MGGHHKFVNCLLVHRVLLWPRLILENVCLSHAFMAAVLATVATGGGGNYLLVASGHNNNISIITTEKRKDDMGSQK